MSTKTLKVKFQSEKYNEPEFFEANVTVDYSLDYAHGADADGNRGMEKMFINEITVNSCIDEEATLVELPLSDRMMDDIWGTIWENFQA